MNDVPDDESFDDFLGSQVGTLNGLMGENPSLSTGDMADLRRVQPEEPYTPALWKLMEDLDLRGRPGWLDQETRETRWAALMMGMAMNAGLHDYGVPLGEALAEAGWSELRFVRLMRATDTRLVQEVRRMAQYLGSKDQRADWTDVGRLLFSQEGDVADSYRRNIARPYYRRLYQEEAS